MANEEIKVGQIYRTKKSLIIITRVKDCNTSFISHKGYAETTPALLVKSNLKLLAEYPTWQEAVNSKEFKGEK